MRFLFSVFLLVNANTSVAQVDEFFWKSDRKLVWQDFKAIPDNTSSYAAMTYSGMSYSFSAEVVDKKVEVKYKVKCFFNQKKSWCKPIHLKDLYLLKHEQLHFDITELYARKLRKELSEYKFTSNVKVEVKNLYDNVNKEKIAIQKQYDLETNHSAIKSVQKEWGLKINNELEKYINFASK